MHQKLTMTRTPEKNGVIEWKNQTLIEAVRSMAVETNVPAFL